MKCVSCVSLIQLQLALHSVHVLARVMVMLGCLLGSVGMVAGAYTQNLLQLYITVGFRTGKRTATEKHLAI